MKRRYLYNILIKLLPLAADVIIIYSVFNFAYYLRFYNLLFVDMFPAVKGIPDFIMYHKAVLGVCVGWVVIFVFSGLYDKLYVSSFDRFVQVLKSVTLAVIITSLVTFLYREFEYSRLVLIIAWLISLFAIHTAHEIIKTIDNYLLYRLFGPRRVLVIGNGKTTDVFRKYFERNKKYRVYYYNSIKDTGDLYKLTKEKRISEIIITSLKVKHDELSEISNVCDELGVDFRVVPDILELRMGEIIVDDSFGIPLLRIKPVSLYGTNRIIKRVTDIIFSILFLGLFMLPLLIIAVAIMIESRGGIFYIKRRVGYKGRKFDFYKFRSMVKEADDLLEQLKYLSERQGPVFKMKGDPRITLIGKIIRKLSLDELPQVINVLRGEMSIIGPRPQVIWEAESYDEFARKRLNVLPGITGLWQVSGRAALGYDDMIRLDIFYIEHWSLGLDLKILLKTIPTVFSGEGAY